MSGLLKFLIKFLPMQRLFGVRLKGYRTLLTAIGATLTGVALIITKLVEWSQGTPDFTTGVPPEFPLEIILATVTGVSMAWGSYTASLPAREALKVATETKAVAIVAAQAAAQSAPPEKVEEIKVEVEEKLDRIEEMVAEAEKTGGL
jgi:hypothetical protein